MQYKGGKTQSVKHIKPVIEDLIKNHDGFIDVFSGGLSIPSKLELPDIKTVILNDANKALINLYNHLKNGYELPDELSEKEWYELRDRNDYLDPRTAWAAFGCSLHGSWFRHYAKNKIKRNYPLQAKNSLKRKFESDTIKRAVFTSCDYKEINPVNKLIYCDPPYKETDGYIIHFDHEDFYKKVKEWYRNGNTILLSEYTIPSKEWEIVKKWERKQPINNKVVTEYLLKYNPKGI